MKQYADVQYVHTVHVTYRKRTFRPVPSCGGGNVRLAPASPLSEGNSDQSIGPRVSAGFKPCCLGNDLGAAFPVTVTSLTHEAQSAQKQPLNCQDCTPAR